MPLRVDQIVAGGEIFGTGLTFQWNSTPLGNGYYLLTPLLPFSEYILDAYENKFSFKRPVQLIEAILHQTDDSAARTNTACQFEICLPDELTGNEIHYLYVDESGVYTWIETFGEEYIVPADRTLWIEYNNTANYRLYVRMIIKVLDDD